MATTPIPLTLYLNVAASTTLSTANTLTDPPAVNGTSSTRSTTVGTATGYGELYAQGTSNAWAGAGSMGTPSGNGWLYEPASSNQVNSATCLENTQIQSGTWSGSYRFTTNTGTVVADIYVNAYKRSSGGVYTSIFSQKIAGVSIGTGGVTKSFTTSSLAAASFAVGDKLYQDIWPNITTGGSSTTVIKVSECNSTLQGIGVAFLVTPGFYITATSQTDSLTPGSETLLSTTEPSPSADALSSSEALLYTIPNPQPFDSTDSSTSTESLTTLSNELLSESSTVTELLLALEQWFIVESGPTVSEGLLLTIPVPFPFDSTDSGVLAEILLLGRSVFFTESSTSTDIPLTQERWTFLDSGPSLGEAVFLGYQPIPSDTVVGSDVLLLSDFLALGDSTDSGNSSDSEVTGWGWLNVDSAPPLSESVFLTYEPFYVSPPPSPIPAEVLATEQYTISLTELLVPDSTTSSDVFLATSIELLIDVYTATLTEVLLAFSIILGPSDTPPIFENVLLYESWATTDLGVDITLTPYAKDSLLITRNPVAPLDTSPVTETNLLLQSELFNDGGLYSTNPYGITYFVPPTSSSLLSPQVVSDIRAWGAGAVIRYQLQWFTIEKTPGVYTWTQLDDAVQKCNSAGLRIMHCLQSAPPWHMGVDANGTITGTTQLSSAVSTVSPTTVLSVNALPTGTVMNTGTQLQVGVEGTTPETVTVTNGPYSAGATSITISSYQFTNAHGVGAYVVSTAAILPIPADFAIYGAAVASRYNGTGTTGKIDFLQIGNEDYDLKNPRDTQSQMLTLAIQAVYPAIKAVYPTAVCGACAVRKTTTKATTHILNWMTNLWTYNGGIGATIGGDTSFFLDFHYYRQNSSAGLDPDTQDKDTPNVATEIQLIQSIAQSYGYTLPVICGETGWDAFNNTTDVHLTDTQVVSFALQSQYTLEMLDALRTNGAYGCYIFTEAAGANVVYKVLDGVTVPCTTNTKSITISYPANALNPTPPGPAGGYTYLPVYNSMVSYSQSYPTWGGNLASDVLLTTDQEVQSDSSVGGDTSLLWAVPLPVDLLTSTETLFLVEGVAVSETLTALEILRTVPNALMLDTGVVGEVLAGGSVPTPIDSLTGLDALFVTLLEIPVDTGNSTEQYTLTENEFFTESGSSTENTVVTGVSFVIESSSSTEQWLLQNIEAFVDALTPQDSMVPTLQMLTVDISSSSEQPFFTAAYTILEQGLATEFPLIQDIAFSSDVQSSQENLALRTLPLFVDSSISTEGLMLLPLVIDLTQGSSTEQLVLLSSDFWVELSTVSEQLTPQSIPTLTDTDVVSEILLSAEEPTLVESVPSSDTFFAVGSMVTSDTTSVSETVVLLPLFFVSELLPVTEQWSVAWLYTITEASTAQETLTTVSQEQFIESGVALSDMSVFVLTFISSDTAPVIEQSLIALLFSTSDSTIVSDTQHFQSSITLSESSTVFEMLFVTEVLALIEVLAASEGLTLIDQEIVPVDTATPTENVFFAFFEVFTDALLGQDSSLILFTRSSFDTAPLVTENTFFTFSEVPIDALIATENAVVLMMWESFVEPLTPLEVVLLTETILVGDSTTVSDSSVTLNILFHLITMILANATAVTERVPNTRALIDILPNALPITLDALS